MLAMVEAVALAVSDAVVSDVDAVAEAAVRVAVAVERSGSFETVLVCTAPPCTAVPNATAGLKTTPRATSRAVMVYGKLPRQRNGIAEGMSTGPGVCTHVTPELFSSETVTCFTVTLPVLVSSSE